jgi:hypothetical protein
MPRMDLQSGAIALALMAVLFGVLTFRNGLRTIQSARKMTFYHLRRQREAIGWRRLGLAVLLLVLAAVLPVYGLPIAYEYFPPSPTPSLTPTITLVPTITLTPTITLSPTITDTPVVSDTPTVTPTPFIPVAVLAQFQSSVTPDPNVVFSPLDFTTVGSSYPVAKPQTVFQNPVGHLYGIFTYEHMLPGVQWTALWWRNGQLVRVDSRPWNGGTGGSGYTDWNPQADEWEPGIYTVQTFVGETFIRSDRFLVEGGPPTLSPTPTAKPTYPPTPSRIPSVAAAPESTRAPIGTATP